MNTVQVGDKVRVTNQKSIAFNEVVTVVRLGAKGGIYVERPCGDTFYLPFGWEAHKEGKTA